MVLLGRTYFMDGPYVHVVKRQQYNYLLGKVLKNIERKYRRENKCK